MMTVPAAPFRSLQARCHDRARPRSRDCPVPDRGGNYPRHRLTINTRTAVVKFHDERDILSHCSLL